MGVIESDGRPRLGFHVFAFNGAWQPGAKNGVYIPSVLSAAPQGKLAAALDIADQSQRPFVLPRSAFVEVDDREGFARCRVPYLR